MASHRLFILLILAITGERLFELSLSLRNRRRALALGGIESGQGHYPWMVLIHSLLLITAPLEVFVLNRPFLPALGIPMLALVAGTMVLRYWAISTLGDRWNTRVIVLPGVPPVAGGPYRYLRHPNYLAVVVEVFALPLVHTAWITALVFSALNAMVLRVRIACEERALGAGSAYQVTLAGRPGLLPRWGSPR